MGTMILKEMNKQKLPGEVTFMPLNRLHVRNIDYPQTKDAIAMVSKLEYEDRYDKALRYIFGRTLICRNLEVATQLARTTGLDCVTLDGDQVSSKGSLTGGYFNKSRSRLEIQKTRSEKTEEIADQEEDMKKLRGKLGEIESEINRVVSEMQKTETRNSKAKDVFDKVKTDVRLMKEELNNIGNYLKTDLKTDMKTDLKSDLKSDLKTDLKSDLKTDLKSVLKSDLISDLKCDLKSLTNFPTQNIIKNFVKLC